MASLTAACVQINGGQEIAANLAVAIDLIKRAGDLGADYIMLPENAVAMNMGRRDILSRAHTEADHPALPVFRDLARDLGVVLHLGSLHIALSDSQCQNRSFVIGPDGAILARYAKIHMFDVDLAGGESYRESETFEPGDRAVVLPLPLAGGACVLGLSICYDLRFPALYRALAQAGANILAVPAAFTRQTGQAHWHALLRTRAIENGCFVVAAAQTGTHHRGRETFGHSLIVAPWGEVLADGGEAVGVVTARLDLDRVAAARAAVPSLLHDRDFAEPQILTAPEGALGRAPMRVAGA